MLNQEVERITKFFPILCTGFGKTNNYVLEPSREYTLVVPYTSTNGGTLNVYTNNFFSADKLTYFQYIYLEKWSKRRFLKKIPELLKIKFSDQAVRYKYCRVETKLVVIILFAKSFVLLKIPVGRLEITGENKLFIIFV